MSARIGLVIGWICAILVAAFNIFAGVMKFTPVLPGSPAEEMANRLGILGMMKELGAMELIIVVLFLIPRTSTVGFVLIIGYMAGALATNLTHGFTHMEALPMYISLGLLTISAYFRNPELLSRLLGRPVPAKV